MTSATRLRALRYALLVVGLISIVGLFPLTRLWPSGWRWEPEGESYLQMIVGIYATLGVFLVIASRDPERHLSLIWFTVWSSVVHGAIMGVQSVVHPMHRGHLLGDVPALFVIAAVLGYLTPRHSSGVAPAR
ncbi:MAG: DUF6632 domain-containing protein [Polyangia bacterium]